MKNSFKPNATALGRIPVRIVGSAFQVTSVGHTWIACEFPDRILRPVKASEVREAA